jgi:hypothetical protein
MEPKLVMFERSNSTRSRRGGCANHVFRLAGLAAAALLALTISTIGQSQACPKHHKESRETVAAVVHKPAARSVFVATALPSSPAKEVNHGNLLRTWPLQRRRRPDRVLPGMRTGARRIGSGTDPRPRYLRSCLAARGWPLTFKAAA